MSGKALMWLVSQGIVKPKKEINKKLFANSVTRAQRAVNKKTENMKDVPKTIHFFSAPSELSAYVYTYLGPTS